MKLIKWYFWKVSIFGISFFGVFEEMGGVKGKVKRDFWRKFNFKEKRSFRKMW